MWRKPWSWWSASSYMLLFLLDLLLDQKPFHSHQWPSSYSPGHIYHPKVNNGQNGFPHNGEHIQSKYKHDVNILSSHHTRGATNTVHVCIHVASKQIILLLREKSTTSKSDRSVLDKLESFTSSNPDRLPECDVNKSPDYVKLFTTFLLQWKSLLLLWHYTLEHG